MQRKFVHRMLWNEVRTRTCTIATTLAKGMQLGKLPFYH